jgi:hypothetical protein
MQRLNIPKKIHVGYQNRDDTYTGKLAYVIYTDEKGKVRKETSWDQWRDKKVDPDNFDNEPTAGFVLNKGVGGVGGSWSSRNVRNEYIRIYDPRGFEFEISVANLLFILTECNAFKGKGLEGEFVYAWGGTELILLPVGCFEYKESTKFTALQSQKVTKKDMKEGRVYQHKNTHQMIYLGRHKTRKLERYWYYYDGDGPNPLMSEPTHPVHVFYDLEDKKWHFERGFTKLAKIESDESHPDFADLYTKFVSSEYVSEFASVVLTPVTIEQVTKQQGRFFYIKTDDGYQLVLFSSCRYRSWYNRPPNTNGMTDDYFWPHKPTIVEEVNKDNLCADRSNLYYGDPNYAVSRGYIKNKELFTAEIELKSNKKIGVSCYVER